MRGEDLPEAVHLIPSEAALLDHLHLQLQVPGVAKVVDLSGEQQKLHEVELTGDILVHLLERLQNVALPLLGLRRVREVLGDQVHQLAALYRAASVQVVSIEELLKARLLPNAVARARPDVLDHHPSVVAEPGLEAGLVDKYYLALLAVLGLAWCWRPVYLVNERLCGLLNDLRIRIRTCENGHGLLQLADMDLQHARDRGGGELLEDRLPPLCLVLEEPAHELDELRELQHAAAIQVDVLHEVVHLLHRQREAKPAEHLPDLQGSQRPRLQPPLPVEDVLQLGELLLREALDAAVGAEEGAEFLERHELLGLALPHAFQDLVDSVLGHVVAKVRQCQPQVLTGQLVGDIAVLCHHGHHVLRLRLPDQPDDLQQLPSSDAARAFRVHLVAEAPNQLQVRGVAQVHGEPPHLLHRLLRADLRHGGLGMEMHNLRIVGLCEALGHSQVLAEALELIECYVRALVLV
mmetsp:Transcript_4313/g.12908  ORF Transcript_4313/g.12908 Transcript_4313/m.12908 type:complete len:464 (+) Transcript_4313:312-1703(+)